MVFKIYLFVEGIGRRYANIVLKKADIPLSKRAGELSEEEVDKIITIMQGRFYFVTFFVICRESITDSWTELSGPSIFWILNDISL